MTNEEAIQILKTWRITGDKAHEALDMAISALAKDINVPSNDCVSREAAIDALIEGFRRSPTIAIRAKDMIEQLPSVQPEKLTYKEQKIILSAMLREETRLCKEVDEKYPVEEKDTLEFVCKEILRKVKKALC